MDESKSHIFTPNNFQDLFLALKAFPDAQFWAGGTGILFGQGERLLSLERTIVSLSAIEELKSITRTERYLELGAMVHLSRALKLKKILPPILFDAISELASPQIRNMATLGGNLAGSHRYHDLASPLSALGAHIELRSPHASRWLPASRFIPVGKKQKPDKQELITRIRIPLEPWSFSVYKKLGPGDWVNDETVSFSLLVRIQKETIEDIRLVICGKSCIRNRDLETAMSGKTLPLSRKERDIWLDAWEKMLAGENTLSLFTRSQLFSLIVHFTDNLSR